MRYSTTLATPLSTFILVVLAFFSMSAMADPRHPAPRHYQARQTVARPAPVAVHHAPRPVYRPAYRAAPRASVNFYYGVQPGYTVAYPVVAYPVYVPYAVAPVVPAPVAPEGAVIVPEGAVIVPAPEVAVIEQGTSESDLIAARIIGTVIGGVVGHQLGRGSGKTAATIGGAVVGGLIGDQLAK